MGKAIIQQKIRQHIHVTQKFDYTTIANRLSSYSHQTGVVYRFMGSTLPFLANVKMYQFICLKIQKTEMVSRSSEQQCVMHGFFERNRLYQFFIL